MIYFFKKLQQRIKCFFARKQRPDPLLYAPEEPIENMNQLIKSLIHVEVMLCQSACVAEDRYSNDAEHLMKIIRNQHVGVESVLKSVAKKMLSILGGKFSNYFKYSCFRIFSQ